MSTWTALQENFEAIARRIQLVQNRSLHNQLVCLLAVSKGHSVDAIRSLYHLGVRSFGENYVHEANLKQSTLKDYDIDWHFLGRIQSNKINKIVHNFNWVHTLDREDIAVKLYQACVRMKPSKLLNVCIQVNISGESTKGGIQPEALEDFVQFVAGFSGIRLRGLMAIPARVDTSDTDSLQDIKSKFSTLRELFLSIKASGQFDYFDTLSMGMSQDYETAILEGATIVRIGTALFGARVYT